MAADRPKPISRRCAALALVLGAAGAGCRKTRSYYAVDYYFIPF